MKHTLIIGGTRGLGKIVTELFLREAHSVTVLARTSSFDEYEKLFFVSADLYNQDSYLKALDLVIEKRGKIDNLIFIQRYRGQDDWNQELDVNLRATQNIIDYLKAQFVTDNYPSIVVVSSMGSQYATDDIPLSYAISKAGLNQLVRHYAMLLGPSNIRVNAVSTFSFIKPEAKQYYDESKLSELYKKIIPLKRMCKAEDVANCIAFLCSSKSSFITGQNHIVDGGLSIINPETLAKILLPVKYY